ncbi:MAG: hypothetical protein JNM58_17515 [Xanthomonadaceae bacterium]|nr:hypothetical protein [Xanthomonadaceae bacterium]
MLTVDCLVGETLRIGRDIAIQLTGRVDAILYVFIDASVRHELGGVGGFHASAPSGIQRRAHVLALHDGEVLTIGPVVVAVVAVRLRIPGASVLREVRLHLTAPPSLTLERRSQIRPSNRRRRPLGERPCSY